MKHKYVIVGIAFLSALLMGGCGVINEDDPENGFGLDPPGFPNTYWAPSVSADGETIVFHRTKVTRLDASGVFWIDHDSTGIWMVRPDGSGFQFLMQGALNNPVLSPNGKWLAYEAGAQIFKVPFDGHAVDTTGIVQLTEEGRNFSPAWSPDGEWIAYHKSICEGPETCGIWLMRSNGSEQKKLTDSGSNPDWHPFENHILFRTRAVTQQGQAIGDSLWVYQFDNDKLDKITFLNGNNRNPRYSPDGSIIAFQSQKKGEPRKIWVMNSDGTNPHPITEYANYPSWTPDGRIVYVQGSPRPWDNIVEDYMAIWIMNADGSSKRQLTFNHGMQWTQ